MNVSAWRLRAPDGTTHVLRYVQNRSRVERERGFVLPACWCVLFANKLLGDEVDKTLGKTRTRARLKLKPVSSRTHVVTCMYCIGLGLTR